MKDTPQAAAPSAAGNAPRFDWGRALQDLGPIFALILIWGIFAYFNPVILKLGAVEQIVQQTVIVGIAAIGMTLIIISGGIDLAVGSTIALCACSGAYALKHWGGSPLVVVLTALGAGLAAGFMHGVLIVHARLIPFISTLGTLLVYRGLAREVADSQPISVQSDWLRFWLSSLPENLKWMLIPPGGWLMILLAGMVAWGLRYTVAGRHVYALGSNEQTAVLCGVNTRRVKLLVYSLGGGFAAVSGLMSVSYQDQGDPNTAQGLELDVIAAVVIGGGSLSGGAGSVFGSLVGALIMTVIRVGCSLNGVEASTTQIITGAIILAAVAVDRLRHPAST